MNLGQLAPKLSTTHTDSQVFRFGSNWAEKEDWSHGSQRQHGDLYRLGGQLHVFLLLFHANNMFPPPQSDFISPSLSCVFMLLGRAVIVRDRVRMPKFQTQLNHLPFLHYKVLLDKTGTIIVSTS